MPVLLRQEACEQSIANYLNTENRRANSTPSERSTGGIEYPLPTLHRQPADLLPEVQPADIAPMCTGLKGVHCSKRLAICFLEA
jgi:hypothetical protein